MSSRGPRPSHVRILARTVTTIVAAAALIVGLATPVAAAAALPAATPGVSAGASGGPAATGLAGGPAKTTLVGFKPGSIISDAVFTNKTTMTEAQIQAFFESKVKTCRTGYTCLKDFRITSVNRVADKYCSGYTGAANESAARIIFRVSQACNINPQVLIVMLQKEQGLITHTWPSQWRYDAALGQGCPDDAPCNPAYVGFFHQIYGAARQMQIYMEGRYFTWYAPGKTWNILYHPNRACGSAPVYVANKATASLYYYTPYQPNAAALAAGYGTGNSCSSYGNRNFYNYFTDWFGPTTVSQFSVSKVAISGYVLPGQAITANALFSPVPDSVSYQWFRNGTPIAQQTGRSYSILASDVGATLHVVVTARKNGHQNSSAQSTPYVTRSVTVGRLAGADREQTAVQVSREAWPTGTRTVFMATGRDFADALTAAPAASRAGGALLLTDPDRLSAAVRDELRRLAPTRVVLMGGTGVLTPAVQTQIAAAVPQARIERAAGADRYATSRAVVEQGGASPAILVATGRDFPDALSAAAAGSASRTPVILVNGEAATLDAATVATIRKTGATKATIVGGDGVVSAGISAQLASLGLSVGRLAGTDRYATNMEVNRTYYPTSALKALIAPGSDFPDALSASSLAGRWNVPLLLSEPDCLKTDVTDFFVSRGTKTITLVGGPAVLSEDGAAQLRRCG
ncbi:cell wall-binding repeat-containing protein [Microbacterium sp.]|uniref:cell wall-binding repeat-containing protein n=1 Tax=Microbacterium sp. TaxID=51671 RepID=UPI0028109FA7|nr:cell wall-binding repeat-containing protein [Microbacterium sp.]